jgi:RNA recognition motif-containing protein
MTKLFVANLPFATTETEITDLFRRFGEVSEIELIRDWDGGFKGYLFAVMDDKAAKAAIDALNGSWFAGRKITVKPDEHKATRCRGRIIFVSDDASYGRIRTDAGESIYMPRRQYRAEWNDVIGQAVEFEISRGFSGLVARDVRPTQEKARQQLT